MAGFPKEISDFMAKYGVTADEIWKIPQGNAYAVKHKALERVAAEQGIKFDRPAIVQSDLANKVVAVVVFGSMGVRTEWATGEAAPYNNKNGYPLAMSEKRAKDRVVLKILQAHGALYSEDEADDFKKSDDLGRSSDEKDVQREEWGTPGDVAAYKLLLNELKHTLTQPSDVVAFRERNKGMIPQLRVGPRRNLEQQLDRIGGTQQEAAE